MNIWYTGEIIRKGSSEIEEFQIVDLDISYLNRLVEFQEKVYETIADKDTYVKSTFKEYERFLSGEGWILGFLVEDELIGYRINSHNRENLNYFKDLLKIDGDKKMFYLDATLIDETCRGNHLQRKAIKISLEYSLQDPDFQYAFATVSPKNIPSMKSLLNNGVYFVKGRKIYSGKDRFIALYDRNKKISTKGERKLVSISQFDKISEFLEEGYIGVSLKKSENEYLLQLIRS
ncbi:MAG: hypothetical protein JW702_01560 [Clostridiales bacterium]|nr:hypothetical protein [Clostridiales bacterium]